MKSEVFFGLDSFFDPLHTAIFVTGLVASDSSLDVPGGSIVDCFPGKSERLIDNLLLEAINDGRLNHPIYFLAGENSAHDKLSAQESPFDLVTEHMLCQSVLDSVGSLNLLVLPAVSFELSHSVCKNLLEFKSPPLLLLLMFLLVPLLRLLHKILVVFELQSPDIN